MCVLRVCVYLCDDSCSFVSIRVHVCCVFVSACYAGFSGVGFEWMAVQHSQYICVLLLDLDVLSNVAACGPYFSSTICRCCRMIVGMEFVRALVCEYSARDLLRFWMVLDGSSVVTKQSLVWYGGLVVTVCRKS